MIRVLNQIFRFLQEPTNKTAGNGLYEAHLVEAIIPLLICPTEWPCKISHLIGEWEVSVAMNLPTNFQA